MSRILTRKAFGLRADPWSDLSIQTADGLRVAAMVEAAVGPTKRTDRQYGQAMVSILGERGAGKNVAVQNALDAYPDIRIISLLRLTRERAHMGDIEDAIISDLSKESPRRSGEARSRQLRRILGEAQLRHPVVLLIDDSHVLHPSTQRGLKRLRELTWTGRRCLIGVILIGQRDTTAAIDEVGLRSDSVWLEGLTRDEAMAALNLAIGPACEPGAIAAMADSPKIRKTWLDLQSAADQALAIAMASGHKKITVADVVQAIGAGLKVLAQTIGVSQAEIAKAIGKSEPQVSRLLSGERQDAETQDRITEFLLKEQHSRKNATA